MMVRDSITRTGARTPGAEDYPTSMAAHGRNAQPDTVRDYCGRFDVRERQTQTKHQSVYAGSRLKPAMRGKVLSYMPAFQPYRGKPAVRNDREGRGNIGIIRSPISASTLPDCGGCEVTRIPTATPLYDRNGSNLVLED